MNKGAHGPTGLSESRSQSAFGIKKGVPQSNWWDPIAPRSFCGCATAGFWPNSPGPPLCVYAHLLLRGCQLPQARPASTTTQARILSSWPKITSPGTRRCRRLWQASGMDFGRPMSESCKLDETPPETRPERCSCLI